jgi:imidazolonepropionase-like amidohydrolase
MNTALALLLTLPSAFAISNVRVEVGDGTTLEKATVVIDDKGKISDVGPGAKIPAGAKRIDGKGRTLAPGFIETRGQLGLVEVLMEKTTADHNAGMGPFAPAFRAADGFRPSSVRIPIEREEGVTSAITSPTGGVLYGTGSWFELTGELDDRPDPAKPIAMFGSVNERAVERVGGSRGGLWLKLREIFDDVRFYKKNKKAYDKAASRQLSLPRVHLAALIPVLDGKLPLVLEVHRVTDILAVLQLKKEEKIDVVITGGTEAWKVASEIAKAKVPVIFHPSIQEQYDFEALRAQDNGAALLHRAGVKLVITANGDWDQSARRIRQEAGIAVAHGLDRQAALRAITLSPAEVFGKNKSVGSVKKGKRANLVLWSGDPFELSSVVERMWIDGESVSLDNRQRQLARRYLEQKAE